jgi:hypothetical protein
MIPIYLFPPPYSPPSRCPVTVRLERGARHRVTLIAQALRAIPADLELLSLG